MKKIETFRVHIFVDFSKLETPIGPVACDGAVLMRVFAMPLIDDLDRRQLDARRLAERAAEAGVLIEPGDAFFQPGDPRLNYFRLAYSSIPEARIEEGIARLAAAVEVLRAEN